MTEKKSDYIQRSYGAIIRNVLLVLFILFLIDCSNVVQELDPKKIYRFDMVIKCGDRSGDGILVLPKKKKYTLRIKAWGKTDLFTLTSCHREVTLNPKSQKISLNFFPTLESNLIACPVLLGGYEKIKGRHSWGFIDFEDSKHTMPANLKCNGKTDLHNGVSVCQSREELFQEISFPQKVRYATSKKCEWQVKKEGFVYRYKVKKGLCVYSFKAIGLDKWHRHTTHGYDAVLVR